MASQANGHDEGPTNTPGRPSLRRKRDDTTTSLWRATIRILVGPDEEEHVVHPHIMRKISFFRGCLDAPMEESLTGVIRLPDDQMSVVEDLVHWAYVNQLPCDLVKQREARKQDSTKFAPEVRRMIRLHALAGKYLAEELKNRTMDAVKVAHHTMPPSPTTIRLVMRLFTEGDSLYDYIMQVFSEEIRYRGGWTAIKAYGKHGYKQFVRENIENTTFCLEALTKYPEGKRNGLTKRQVDMCELHSHIKTPKCANTSSETPRVIRTTF